MITQAQGTRMLGEFEQEVQRVGYEVADKRSLASIFNYLKSRLADATLYNTPQKLKAVEALEQRWQQDRIGKPILADYGQGIIGWDPNGTERGALTISTVLRELRALLVELPEKIVAPEPQTWPAMIAPGVPASTITDAVDVAVAKALAGARQKVSTS